MSPAHASALSRRDRLWPAVSVSVAAHVVTIVWAVTRPAPPPIDLEQKAIVAKLVRLGEKRPESFLPRKPAAQPPPATAAPPAPVPAPAAARTPAPAAKAAPPAPAPPTPAAQARGGGSTLASVLSKVQKQAADERYGSPDGDPGGDSDTAEGDAYYALVIRAVRAHYVAPATIPERERARLAATVALWIEPDGRIARWQQERSSGNAAFDAVIERALRATPRVPPPPDHLRNLLRTRGAALVFGAKE